MTSETILRVNLEQLRAQFEVLTTVMSPILDQFGRPILRAATKIGDTITVRRPVRFKERA